MKNALDKNLLLSLKILYYLEEKRGSRVRLEDIVYEFDINESKVKRIMNTLMKLPQVEINSKSGKGGGYELILNKISQVFSLDELELKSIYLANNLLKKDHGFYLRNHFNYAVSKLKRCFNREINTIEIDSVNKKQGDILSNNDNFRILEMIEEAKINNSKIEITYFSVNSKKMSNRIIHPLKIFYYEESKDYYLIAYCENRKSINHFKLKRMKVIKVLDQKFEKTEFNFEKYIESHVGIHRGEEYDLELILYYPYNIFIKETPVLNNQEIIDINEDKSIFKGRIKGGAEILTWILSLGNGVKVIKPIKLKDKIIKELKKNLENYEMEKKDEIL